MNLKLLQNQEQHTHNVIWYYDADKPVFGVKPWREGLSKVFRWVLHFCQENNPPLGEQPQLKQKLPDS